MSCHCIQIPLQDAELSFFPQLFSQARADALFVQLQAQTNWRQEHTRIYGKCWNLPRLTAWYGDQDAQYTYSGISMQPLPWTQTLRELKVRLEVVAGSDFNSVLLNLYRDGQDSVGWHSDDEKSLGLNPVIASLSFGAARRFVLQHKADKSLRQPIDLTHGSCLLMAGATQHHWRHCITKTQRTCGPRINLTFRKIV